MSINESELQKAYGYRDDRTDLRQYPEVRVSPSDTSRVFTLGDIHGNPIKMIHLLIKYGVIDLPKQSYGQLVQLYDRQVLFSRMHREKVIEGGGRNMAAQVPMDPKAIATRREELEAQLKPLEEERGQIDTERADYIRGKTGYNTDPKYEEILARRKVITDKMYPLSKEKDKLPKALPENYQPQNDYEKLSKFLEAALEKLESGPEPTSEADRAELDIAIPVCRETVLKIKEIQSKPTPDYQDILYFEDNESLFKKVGQRVNQRVEGFDGIKNYNAIYRTTVLERDYPGLLKEMPIELKLFKQILVDNAIVTPGRSVRDGGDMTGDRGANDASVVGAFRVLKDKGLPVDIMLSDHDVHLVEYMETGNGDQMRKFDEHARQANSGVMLIESIERGIVDPREFREDYDAVYQGNLKAVGYSLSADRQEINLDSHAPIDWDVVENMAKKLGVTYRDDSPVHKAYSIDQINRAFQQEYVQKNRVHELNHPPVDRNNVSEATLKQDYPFYFSMWHREREGNTLLNRPERDANGYRQFFTHGHDEGSIKAPNIFNMDRNLGKPLQEVGFTSVTCTSRDMILTKQETAQMEQEFKVDYSGGAKKLMQQRPLIELMQKEETYLHEVKGDKTVFRQCHSDLLKVAESGDMNALNRLISTAQDQSQLPKQSGSRRNFYEALHSAACSIKGEKSPSQLKLDNLHTLVKTASENNNDAFQAAVDKIPVHGGNHSSNYNVANHHSVEGIKNDVVRQLNKAAITTGLQKTVGGLKVQISKIGAVLAKLGTSTEVAEKRRERFIQQFENSKTQLQQIRSLRSNVKNGEPELAAKVEPKSFH